MAEEQVIVQDVGRVVGSRIYSGAADGDAEIRSDLGNKGIEALNYDLYLSESGNLYQYRTTDSDSVWTLIINLKGVGVEGVVVGDNGGLDFTLSDGTHLYTDSVQGAAGSPGPYYIPNVDDEGYLTWTNTGGLPNPNPFLIRADTPVSRMGTESGYFNIVPNVLYVWDEVDFLDIDLTALPPTGDRETVEEYHFFFDSGSNPTELALPEDILWSSDSATEIVPNASYEVKILNGKGKITPYYPENEEELIAEFTVTDELATFYELNDIDYASIRVHLVAPRVAVDPTNLYRFMISLSGRNNSGYCSSARSNLTTVIDYYADIKKFPRPILTVNTGDSFINAPQFHATNETVPQRIRYLKIGNNWSFNDHMPNGTVVQIYGKKY